METKHLGLSRIYQYLSFERAEGRSGNFRAERSCAALGQSSLGGIQLPAVRKVGFAAGKNLASILVT
eukprot:scaffold1311_cov256-Pinguiococcus_pyrenoidosus.AAC.70